MIRAVFGGAEGLWPGGVRLELGTWGGFCRCGGRTIAMRSQRKGEDARDSSGVIDRECRGSGQGWIVEQDCGAASEPAAPVLTAGREGIY